MGVEAPEVTIGIPIGGTMGIEGPGFPVEVLIGGTCDRCD